MDGNRHTLLNVSLHEQKEKHGCCEHSSGSCSIIERSEAPARLCVGSRLKVLLYRLPYSDEGLLGVTAAPRLLSRSSGDAAVTHRRF